MDIVDYANDQAERELAALIAQRAARMAMAPLESSDLCLECGEQISSERQLAVPGCCLCVECAEELERQHALYRAGP